VFKKTEAGISEHVNLALGVRTKGNGYNPKDDAVLNNAKKVVETELKEGLDWTTEKGVVEINLSAVLDELPQPEEYIKYTAPSPITYQAVSSYPAIARDIALWVAESVEADEVKKAIDEAAGERLVRSTLFDTFSKEGRTSYAFRLVFQSMDRTLTDEEINQQMESVYELASSKGWEVR
jgi:phenylalanyl-tRNA synthetase beta chain